MQVEARIAISVAAALLIVTAYFMIRDVQRRNVRGFPRDLWMLSLFMLAFGVYRAIDAGGWSSVGTFATAATLAMQGWFVRWYQLTRYPPVPSA